MAAITEILANIDGHIQGPISGFDLKYFAKFGSSSGRYPPPSTAPSPEAFLQWFASFSSCSAERDGARGTWHCYPASEPASADAGAHLFLTLSTVFDPSAKNGWRDVQVVGQFCRRHDSVGYRDGLLSLYIRGSLLELWVFDRSGIYSCDGFDIQNEFARFLSVVRSYRLMTDRDLGRSDIIENNEVGSCIKLEAAAVTSLGELYLEDQPIAASRELVGEGTTCYRAKTLHDSNRWDYVVKFKWRLATDRPEEELLKLVKEKNVWGVVSLDYYKEVESTVNLRQGLQGGLYRKFLTVQHRMGRYEGAGQGQGFPCGTKGIIEDTEETDRFFEDRIFTCAVISPAGRPLHTFKTLLELLEVLRDAVKGHRSLLQDAQILHQDVSVPNIVITDAQGDRDPKGIMIDLDVGMILDIGPRTPGEVTGTLHFMAIGILKSRAHTYRHDLESFLYVFLWTIISNRSSNPPKTSKLRHWTGGSWDELARRKALDMDKDNFGSILAEFTPEFHSVKLLAETLRQTLFPFEDGAIWTGTDSAPEAVNGLYDGIIGAFEEAITFESRK